MFFRFLIEKKYISFNKEKFKFKNFNIHFQEILGYICTINNHRLNEIREVKRHLFFHNSEKLRDLKEKPAGNKLYHGS